jgi:hypothetical protein
MACASGMIAGTTRFHCPVPKSRATEDQVVARPDQSLSDGAAALPAGGLPLHRKESP